MLTLGIDTSTRVSSVALCDGEKILGEVDSNVGMTHSEGLVPQLEVLLERTHIQKSELELIAVSRGPGSFTGLRIGMATAEALAYSLKIPLRAVDTLEAISYNLPVAGVLLVPVLDAQKGNLYVGQYLWDQGRLEEVEPVSILSQKEIIPLMEQKDRPVILLGECHRIPKKEGFLVAMAPESARMPRASSVAILAQENYEPGDLYDYFGMEPFYIRRSEAEELWEKRHPSK